MTRYVKYQILILFVILLTVGIQAQQISFFNNLEDTIFSANWINSSTIDTGFAHSGNHYSIADSSRPFGLGFRQKIPEEFHNRNTLLDIKGWAKSNVVADQADFVITILQNGKQVLWKSIPLKGIITDKEKWFQFSDSVLIPASITKNGTIKAYLWNSDGKNSFAIDDLEYSFSVFQNPTFIPDIKNVKKAPGSENRKLLFENTFYRLYYFPMTKRITVYSTTDSLLIKDILYYSVRNIKSQHQTTQLDFSLDKTKDTKNSKQIIFKIIDKGWKLKLTLICRMYSPEIFFEVEERYKSKQTVSRESIIIESGQKITEVFRANRKEDNAEFQNEYWLDKQGVKFGKGKESAIVYHTPDISSLQLKSPARQLWVNLDYEKDHPFLHFPLNNDTTDEKVDWSESIYKKGDKRQFSFTVYTGMPVRPLPRFMKNPDGFLATYIWTEHADFTDIRTNRAVYFGSETIENADDATGGFVKYDIPVTKSVFYDNPGGVTNTEDSDGLFNSLECSIMTDTSFSGLLEQLHKQGDEICLHTPENYTSTRKRMKTALRFMRDNFGSPTWIDHGYNNHLENNREDLVCDGAVKKSGYYFLKLWKKYGVRYFYDPYYEDYLTFEMWHFSDFPGKPYPGFGDFLPDPDFWKHPSRTGDIVHWPTKGVFYAPRESDWDYYFNDQVLDEFIAGWGVKINHCYPPRVNPAKGFWEYGPDSTIIAAPGFNKTLERMAALKNERRLNVTTIKDFLDYQLAVENVKYEILPDGRLKVTNRGDKTIKNLSFALRSAKVTVNGQKPNDRKTVNGELIFWFDLNRGESKVIRTINHN